MAYSGYSEYNRVATAIDSKEIILVKLLDGVVRFLKAAKIGIDTASPKVKGENISKAIAIIIELDCALDREIDSSLVENLSLLYRYILARLTQANLKSDSQIIVEVEKLILPIKEGFEESLKLSSESLFDGHTSSFQTIPQKGLCVAA